MSNSSEKKKKWIKTLQFFAAYLVAAWTFLQFVDWILNRYNISPYWVDILLWLFIGIIPSLLIYLYHQERLNQRIFKRREKIIFPLNGILLIVALYFGFGNSDLGATTKSINYTTEEGEERSAFITKEEFRTGFYIFNFEPKKEDSINQWLDYGISDLLYQDLLQNKNLRPVKGGNDETSSKVRESSYFYDYYVDGEFEVIDGLYKIETYIRNAKNAKILEQKTFEGTNILDLIDDITVFVASSLDSNEFNSPNYIDLDISDFMSDNLEAIEHYRYGRFEKAFEADNTFALAYLAAASRNLLFNRSKFEERALADRAYALRRRLPLQRQGEALILRNLAYDEYDNAEQLVKLQLEVDPSDVTYNRILYNIYGRTKNLEAYTQLAYDAWQNEKSRDNGYIMIEAALIREDYDYLLGQLRAFSLLQPNDDILFSFNLMPQLLKGDIEAAKKTQDRVKLLHPDLSNMTKVHDSAIDYQSKNKVTTDILKRFEGNYRNNNGEQLYSFWVNKNSLLLYVSNQYVNVLAMAGDASFISGHAVGGRTGSYRFLEDESGQFFAIDMEQNNYRNSGTFRHWRIDDLINEAEKLLSEKKYDEAKLAYEKAIDANPKHYYLKDALAHVTYVQSISKEQLEAQLQNVAGSYGPRNFWIDNGRLYYKRQGLDNGIIFPTIELLPMSEDLYMNQTNLGAQFGFRREGEADIISYVKRYNLEQEQWVKSFDSTNVFKKY